MGIAIIPAPSTAGAPFSRYAQITSSGTWAHPDGYASPRLVRVLLYGGGGGGGGGAAAANTGTASNVTFTAGLGGGSGYVAYQDYVVTADQTVTIGAGGIGGAAVSSTGYAEGNSGNAGGATSFGTLSVDGGGGSVQGVRHTALTNDEWYSAGNGGQVGPYVQRRTDWTRSAWSGLYGSSGDGVGYPATDTYPTEIRKGGSWRFYNNVSVNVTMRGNNNNLNAGNTNSAQNYRSGDYDFWALLPNAGWHSGQIAINSTMPITGFTGSATELIGTARFPGGQCGANKGAASGTVSGNNGSTPASGYGGGGGGGGTMVITGSGTATSGAGGTGTPGLVEVWY